MTKGEIERRLKSVKKLEGDSSAQHALLDDLYIDFIECVSEGSLSPSKMMELASLVLTGEDIDFGRWYG